MACLAFSFSMVFKKFGTEIATRTLATTTTNENFRQRKPFLLILFFLTFSFHESLIFNK